MEFDPNSTPPCYRTSESVNELNKNNKMIMSSNAIIVTSRIYPNICLTKCIYVHLIYSLFMYSVV